MGCTGAVPPQRGPGPGGAAGPPAGAQVTGQVGRGGAREVTRSCPRTHTPASGKHRLGPSAWLHQPVTTGRRWQFCGFCSSAQGTLPTTPALNGPCAGTCRSACSGRWPPCARLAWRGVPGQSRPAAWECRFPDKHSAGEGEGCPRHFAALSVLTPASELGWGLHVCFKVQRGAYSCTYKVQGGSCFHYQTKSQETAEGLCLDVC